LILLLLFSILPGPLTVIKIGGKAPSFLWLDIALVFVVIVMAVRWLMEWDGLNKKSPIAASFLLFLCWGGLTVLQAVDASRAIVLLRNYFCGLVAFLLVYKTVQTEKDVKKMYVALLLWGIILSLMELYSLFRHGDLTLGIISAFLYKNLIATSWGRSNYLAAFDVILIPFVLAVFFAKTSRALKWFTIVSLAMMTTALIVSLSRGGLIACFIAVLMVLARYLSFRTFLPIFALVLVIGLIVLLNPLTFVLIERTSTLERSASLYSRLDFWKETWQIFRDHPITGVGLGNLGYYATFQTAGYSSAHNIVLGLLGELGLVGLMLFAILMVKTLQAIMHSTTQAKSDFTKHLSWGVLCALFGALLHALVEPNFEGSQFSVMAWTIIGLGARLPDLATEEKASEAFAQMNTSPRFH
jgi:O-antigen ligase